MAIEAIGARPHMMLHPAVQSREDTTSSEVRAGDIEKTPKSEKTGESGGDGGRTGLNGRSHLQQSLHHMERSVRTWLKEVLKETEFDAQSATDIREAVKEFKVTLDSVHRETAEREIVDEDVLNRGVRDALAELTESLKITLDGLLPPVPWETEIPPEIEIEGSLQVEQDVQTRLDELA